jgi:hypothetical protein
MKDLLAQAVLIARTRRGEDAGWMQLLVIVVLAVFYVLRNVAKAKSNKAKQADREQLTPKPGRKPPEEAKDSAKLTFQDLRRLAGYPPQKPGPRTRVQPLSRKMVRPQPIAQKVTPEPKPAAQIPTLEPLEESKLGLAEAQIQPDFQELPDLTSKAVRKLGAKRVDIAAETPDAKHLTEILLDYADPDELRRAILHYEILGKPLSLREQSGRIIGL